MAGPSSTRARPLSSNCVAERRWHPSETQERQADGSLLYTVKVAEPMEVVRWAHRFGDEVVVLDIESVDECMDGSVPAGGQDGDEDENDAGQGT